MKITEFCQTLDRHLAAEANQDNRLLLLNAALQQAFKVQDDELAILAFEPTHQELFFIWPKKLSRSGRIPVSTRESLSARTAREKRPQIDNRFVNTRHASIFEKISLGPSKSKEEKKSVLPIQKIMSVPVLRDDALLGIMQLSRKGETAEASGADFTTVELEAFNAIADAVAHHVPWS